MNADSRWPFVLLAGYVFVCCLLLVGGLAYSLVAIPTTTLFSAVGLGVAIPLTLAVGYFLWMVATDDL